MESIGIVAYRTFRQETTLFITSLLINGSLFLSIVVFFPQLQSYLKIMVPGRIPTTLPLDQKKKKKAINYQHIIKTQSTQLADDKSNDR